MKNLFKQALVFALITAMASVAYAEPTVVCAKLKSTHKTGYPVSKDAKALATYLNVKKCSKSFQAACTAKGVTIQYVAADAKLRAELEAAKVARMKEKIAGFSF